MENRAEPVLRVRQVQRAEEPPGHKANLESKVNRDPRALKALRELLDNGAFRAAELKVPLELREHLDKTGLQESLAEPVLRGIQVQQDLLEKTVI